MKRITGFVVVFVALFLFMCDSGVINSDGNNDQNGNDTAIVGVNVAGLWLDTFPKFKPYIMHDLNITVNLKSNDSSEIKIFEIDTKKDLFIDYGTWTQDTDSVYINSYSAMALDTATDTLVDFPSLKDTTIAIAKTNIDTSASPDVWTLHVSDMEFIATAMNITDALVLSIIKGLEVSLSRED